MGILANQQSVVANARRKSRSFLDHWHSHRPVSGGLRRNREVVKVKTKSDIIHVP